MKTLFPVREETISPSEYLQIRQTRRHNIKRATVIPPRLGQRGFGKIHITYRTPQLREAHAR